MSAWSEVDVPRKVVFRGRRAGQDSLEWDTKPATIVDGVHVARTSTSVDKFADLPVRVMNVEKQSCFIKSGTVISDLEPVVVVETDEAPVSTVHRGDETKVKTCNDSALSDN